MFIFNLNVALTTHVLKVAPIRETIPLTIIVIINRVEVSINYA
jgi:hypothetical protein